MSMESLAESSPDELPVSVETSVLSVLHPARLLAYNTTITSRVFAFELDG